MKTNRMGAAWVAVLCSIVLVAGAAALVSSPASAKASINWGHIWKTQLQPRADKRYYTKKKARAKFATKSMLGNYYSKTVSDARYALLGSSYTKAESDANYYSKAQSDAKYAPFPSVIRGTYAILENGNAGQFLSDTISWGVTLSAAPTVHFINTGAAVPAGCAGTPAAPDAAPGNLCVFEELASNTTSRGIFNPATPTGFIGQASAFGAAVFAQPTVTGGIQDFGSWAVRPLALSASKVAGSPRSGSGIAR
jgi:hypothetical protein